ncbi:retrovirus-related pol polyprotein from transposon TNT 1-94 [Tanacetum coccineum]
MQKELAALEANNTWEITTLPPLKTPIGYNWVFRIKYNANGTGERYKARLVAKGFNQKEGIAIDYTETFSPVAKMVNVRTILVLASTSNWHIHQLDINNAFLHGDLQEEVYMALPSGYNKSYLPNSVCNSLSFIKHIKDMLQKEFSIKDLGQLSYCLGIEFIRSSKGIVMTQWKYALDLIEQAGLTNTKHAKTPLDPNVKLTSKAGDLLPDPSIYKALVGKLIYLTINRPDVAFAAQVLSQFFHSPHTSHMEALKRAYCDSDWASYLDSRRSVLGFGFSWATT